MNYSSDVFHTQALCVCVHNVFCYSIPGQSINLVSWKMYHTKEGAKQANFTLDNRRASTSSTTTK